MPAENVAPRALAPTETVYLHAEEFARGKTLLDGVDLLHTDRKVRASDLAEALLATAVLAAEDAGAIRLRVGERRRLLGLRRTEALFADPGPARAPLPEGTLEAAVAAEAARQPREVEAIVHAALREDAPSPELWTVQIAMQGLARRGLLETSQRKVLKVFRVDAYALPQATADLARATPPEAARRLLDAARRERPEEWRLLQQAVRAALRSRREAGDGPDLD